MNVNGVSLEPLDQSTVNGVVLLPVVDQDETDRRGCNGASVSAVGAQDFDDGIVSDQALAQRSDDSVLVTNIQDDLILDSATKTPTPLAILPNPSIIGFPITRAKNKRVFRLASASLEKSNYKRVKGKLFCHSKSKPTVNKHSNSFWQPDSSDIKRVNDRLKQPLVDVFKEANATLELGKALGFKFDKPDDVVQQFFADMISNDAHNWKCSSMQDCL